MQKISQIVCLLVLLVLVATSCMAQEVDQAGEDNNLVAHLVNKRQSGCAGCPSCGCPSFLGCIFCGGSCCYGK